MRGKPLNDELFRALVENSYDGVALVGPDGERIYVSPAFMRLVGYTSEEYAELKPFEVVHPEDRPVIAEAFQAAARGKGGLVQVADIRVRHRDGSLRWGEARISNRLDDPRIGALVLNWRDITERKRAEEELRQSLEALRKTDDERRQLLTSLVTAQEEERRRIASEVHDDSIQVMTAVNLRLQMIRRELGHHNQSAKLAEIGEIVEKATGRLRHLIFELSPPALTRHGLAAALTEYLEQLREDTGLESELHGELESEPPVNQRIVAYRIAQEALTNIRKHAKAHSIRVRLSTHDEGILVWISDDGAGFDTEEALEPAPGHLGLPNMRQRAELAGGWWKIESSPSVGNHRRILDPQPLRQYVRMTPRQWR